MKSVLLIIFVLNRQNEAKNQASTRESTNSHCHDVREAYLRNGNDPSLDSALVFGLKLIISS